MIETKTHRIWSTRVAIIFSPFSFSLLDFYYLVLLSVLQLIGTKRLTWDTLSGR